MSRKPQSAGPCLSSSRMLTEIAIRLERVWSNQYNVRSRPLFIPSSTATGASSDWRHAETSGSSLNEPKEAGLLRYGALPGDTKPVSYTQHTVGTDALGEGRSACHGDERELQEVVTNTPRCEQVPVTIGSTHDRSTSRLSANISMPRRAWWKVSARFRCCMSKFGCRVMEGLSACEHASR